MENQEEQLIHVEQHKQHVVELYPINTSIYVALTFVNASPSHIVGSDPPLNVTEVRFPLSANALLPIYVVPDLIVIDFKASQL